LAGGAAQHRLPVTFVLLERFNMAKTPTDKTTGGMTRGDFGFTHVTSERFLSAIASIAEVHFERRDASRAQIADDIRMFAAVTLSRKGKRGEKLGDLSKLDSFIEENRELLDPIVERAMCMGGWGAK